MHLTEASSLHGTLKTFLKNKKAERNRKDYLRDTAEERLKGKNMILGVDNGNFETKSSGRICYKSGCKQISSDTEADSTIFCNGKLYSVGETRSAMMLNKTLSENMWIQTLPAIAEAIEAAGEARNNVIQLGIGVPLKHFRDMKAVYIEYFKDRSCSFVYKGKKYTVLITDVKCYPQGFAVYLHHYSDLSQYKECVVIDIGGGTMDVFKVVSGKPVTASFRSFSSGVIHLINDIAETLSNAGINVSEDMICEAVSMGSVNHRRKDEINDVCAEKTKEYTRELIGQLKENGYDLELPCILIGGGTSLLCPYLKASDELYVVQTYDNFANAEAYAWLMESGR